MSRLGTETAFSVLAEVNQLKEQGRDIISFGLGEPDFDTPSHIRETAKRALDQGYTHYGPSNGLPELRQAIAQYMQRTRRIPVDPEEVVVTPGAKPIVFDVMMALLNPGDEVLYPNPGYPIYESVADWIGAHAKPLPLLESQNWNFSVDQLVHSITPKIRMIVINSPGNPTGTLLGESELREIARLAVDHNLWVIADEVYSQIIFDGEFNSIASVAGMKERTIIVDGFSKTYAMTGWRLGYGVMNKLLAEQVAKIETNIDSCSCTFSQIAGTQALLGSQDESLYMIEQFKERSKIIVDGLNAIEGVRCLPAQGAFYVFPNVTGACRRLGMQTANELQRGLLEQAGVAVLPRTCFGRKNEGEDQEYIRLSFATSTDNIREGLKRMKQYIER
ncbi:MAG: pyridoxal phosphate-dependent aminotransferase [Candidatus Omnitrophica bacterium]|nr:pyridoxal phosphate-dependent aminotransferase [Candidatus Omnitrophota bacterium]